MNNYTYQARLKEIWTAATEKYRGGHQTPEGFLDRVTIEELATVGLNVMDIFDFVEDFIGRDEPDFETFLMICEARRDYFFTIQEGKLSSKRLDPAALPAKDAEADGIAWLPRLMPKAIAKLRGELPPETMYDCGGDRRFFKTHDIHPAEFLRVAWAYEDDPDKIVDWVKERIASN